MKPPSLRLKPPYFCRSQAPGTERYDCLLPLRDGEGKLCARCADEYEAGRAKFMGSLGIEQPQQQQEPAPLAVRRFWP